MNGGVSHSVKLHDVVFAAARSVVGDPPGEVQAALAGQLETYVGKILYTKDIEAVALADGMRDLFERLIRGGAESDGFLFCLLQATPPEALDDTLIGDPVQRARALTGNVNPPSNVAVGVVLEAIEALYRQAKALRGIDAAKRELETRLEAFDLLAGIAGLSTRSTAEIAHHRGKALNILHRRQEAEAAFYAVLSGPVPLYESRLQLLRMYARDKTRSGLISPPLDFAAASYRAGRVGTWFDLHVANLGKIFLVSAAREPSDIKKHNADLLSYSPARAYACRSRSGSAPAALCSFGSVLLSSQHSTTIVAFLAIATRATIARN